MKNIIFIIAGVFVFTINVNAQNLSDSLTYKKLEVSIPKALGHLDQGFESVLEEETNLTYSFSESFIIEKKDYCLGSIEKRKKALIQKRMAIAIYTLMWYEYEQSKSLYYEENNRKRGPK